MRSDLIQTRLTPEEMSRLRDVVRREGGSVAEFVRETVVAATADRFLDAWTLPRSEAERGERLHALHTHRIVPDSRLRIRVQSRDEIEAVLLVGDDYRRATRETLLLHEVWKHADGELLVALHGGIWQLQRLGVEHGEAHGRSEPTEVVVVFLRLLRPERPFSFR